MRPTTAPLLCAALLATACASPTYGPLPIVSQYGSPGKLKAGQVAVELAQSLPNRLKASGAAAHVQVNDWLGVDAGAEYVWRTQAMGQLGTRFTYSTPRGPIFRFALDGELGAGFGAGGLRCDNRARFDAQGNPTDGGKGCDGGLLPDGRKWYQRAGGGGYTGLGVAFHIAWFSIYGRGRYEVSASQGVPLTHWATGEGGIEFNIQDHAFLRLGVGVVHYWNKAGGHWDQNEAVPIQAGVVIPIQAWEPEAEPLQAPK